MLCHCICVFVFMWKYTHIHRHISVHECVYFFTKYCIITRKYANGLVIDRSAIKICIVNKADKDRQDDQQHIHVHVWEKDFWSDRTRKWTSKWTIIHSLLFKNSTAKKKNITTKQKSMAENWTFCWHLKFFHNMRTVYGIYIVIIFRFFLFIFFIDNKLFHVCQSGGVV